MRPLRVLSTLAAVGAQSMSPTQVGSWRVLNLRRGEVNYAHAPGGGNNESIELASADTIAASGRWSRSLPLVLYTRAIGCAFGTVPAEMTHALELSQVLRQCASTS